ADAEVVQGVPGFAARDEKQVAAGISLVEQKQESRGGRWPSVGQPRWRHPASNRAESDDSPGSVERVHSSGNSPAAGASAENAATGADVSGVERSTPTASGSRPDGTVVDADAPDVVDAADEDTHLRPLVALASAERPRSVEGAPDAGRPSASAAPEAPAGTV